MKKTLLITASILVPMTLQAAPPEGGEGKGAKKGPREVPAEILEQFDTDGDGELSKEERKAARDARRAERIAKYDTDGDGELSKAEKEAARADSPRGGKKGPKKGKKGGAE